MHWDPGWTALSFFVRIKSTWWPGSSNFVCKGFLRGEGGEGVTEKQSPVNQVVTVLSNVAMACNRQCFPLLTLPLHTGPCQSFDGTDIWRMRNGSDLESACFLLNSAPFWISPGFSLYHMLPCIFKKWFLSSCWHSCMEVLISVQPLGEGTKAGGWFNWSDKIITGKCLKLLPYLWGYMQSS